MDNNNINNENNENKSSFFSFDNLPKHIMAPSFLNKEMPLSMFFISAGCLSAVGFGVGLLVGLRKNGGIRQTIRTAPPGVVGSAVKALIGGTAICAAMTTGLVYVLKSAYNIETVKDFGDMMRGKKSEKIPNLILTETQNSTNLDNNNIINFPIDESKLTDEEKLIHKENIKALKAMKYLPYTDEDFKENNNNNNNSNNNNSGETNNFLDKNSEKKK
ncbi:hypothetical protein DDB_G0269812 [Dictyostelium discoideum AX4]|uniref:Transmembrane protein 242 n=1 Tax=Dictyostelium discoideum TaxID=44689 RepID=Q55D19_DICDI|nr:hypothetical protein DDB_G0269812 [Dictyostelium discoideum AX4]EAL72256.1 hypothetical protein DDB_G0269812 [Dictyostelium discoideum AX4]|eukprot:XP_646312.1 hypothetical protein DDB_G0269812 [Dictyostelium discoideum AX4]